MPALALVGAGLGLAGSIFGKSKEARERRRLNRFIDTQSKNLDTWYKNESNLNYLDTAEGQSQYQGLKRMLRDNSKRVDNSLIKTGATAESNIAAKESINQTIGDATRQMAGMGTQRQMRLRDIYDNRKSQYDNMKMGMMQARADSWSTFANNAAETMGDWLGIGTESGGLLNFLKKKPAAGGAAP